MDLEDNKYYTPKPEEFHVGFEYEYLDQRCLGYNNEIDKKIIYDNTWRKVEVKSDDISNWQGNNLWNMEGAIFQIISIEKEKIRVKYLNKEDIESLGFIKQPECYISENYNEYILNFQDFKSIRIAQSIRDITYVLIEYGSTNSFTMNYCFQGHIKNKSELLKVLKQIRDGYK